MNELISLVNTEESRRRVMLDLFTTDSSEIVANDSKPRHLEKEPNHNEISSIVGKNRENL